MAQKPLGKNSNVKKLNKKNRFNGSIGPKKGAKKIAPKRQSVIKQQNIQKKLTSGINRNIEQVMASRVEAISSGQKLNIIKSDVNVKTKGKK
ncbi:hypothetical protein Glove_457g57 [Diversispora epigaea]|uniref:Uncharacterized protein n=1 Tax=Diversispora epigaea TaxID=1348612 RepID=A0A397GPU3_9GLOM|nr:hypothetical protein Glove_457g57 [Diversispora epigaea]